VFPLPESDAGFKTGERLADALVIPAAHAQDPRDGAVDVEYFRILEDRFVVVGRADNQGNHAAHHWRSNAFHDVGARLVGRRPQRYSRFISKWTANYFAMRDRTRRSSRRPVPQCSYRYPAFTLPI
jgi:hypothetical protein